MRKPGCTEPVEFFRNADGHLILAPYSHARPPEGYETCYVDNLPDIRRLQRTLQDQEFLVATREIADEQARRAYADQIVRDRIHAKLASSSTSEYDKDFLREWLKLRDERKDKKYTDAYLCRTSYLWALENDTAKGRGSDDETVNLDRIDA